MGRTWRRQESLAKGGSEGRGRKSETFIGGSSILIVGEEDERKDLEKKKNAEAREESP